MSLQDDFEAALARLREWYADSVKATNFDGPSISHTKPGAVELRLQDYPHERYWRNRWGLAKNDSGRREVIEELEQEYEDLGQSPARKQDFRSWDTEVKVSIAKDERVAKQVARTWGISERTVYRYRKEYG